MICACMAVSVRESRTAVREWACCNGFLYLTNIGFRHAFPCNPYLTPIPVLSGPLSISGGSIIN